MTDTPVTLVISNIGQLVTMDGPVPRVGAALADPGLVAKAAVAVSGDRITAAGPLEQVLRELHGKNSVRHIDAGGRLVTPGLIDPHTHPVFVAGRPDEFEKRLQGKSYMAIAAEGGGIRRSVRELRQCTEDDLARATSARLDRFLANGVTTLEAKSGYGLSLESELKQLRVIRTVQQAHPLELVPTLLAAHEFPDDYRERREEYCDLIINEIIPEVAKQRLAEYSDIFCEEGVFSIEQSRRIQQAAQRHGLKLKFHADELAGSGGAELAAELGAVSADHLVHISERGISAMALSGTVAVLLPGTCFSLGAKHWAPARALLAAGVAVAFSTDCNPGSNNSESPAMMMSLAMVHYRMTASEAMAAVTINAAQALSRADRIGMIRPGYQADLVIWDVADYRELAYHYGSSLVSQVVKTGKPVWRATQGRISS